MAFAKHFNSYELETGILTKYIIGSHSNPLLNCLNNKRLNFNFNKKSQLLKLTVSGTEIIMLIEFCKGTLMPDFILI